MIGARSQITIPDQHPHAPLRLISVLSEPWVDNGRGYFLARLEKLELGTGVWHTVQVADRSLGNNNDDGDWYYTLVLAVTMIEQVEQYRMALHCEAKSTTVPTKNYVRE